LPATEAVLGKRVGHLLAVVKLGARHRHQVLHGDMGRDVARADLLLHRLGKQFHQSQSARHPAEAAIKAARQIIHAVAETLFQFSKQPALFQRRLGFGKPDRAIQHQGIGFAHVPDDGFHPVATQLLQGGDAVVTVDDLIPIGLACDGYDDNRRLLSRCRQ
jgi:hypothetical protein